MKLPVLVKPIKQLLRNTTKLSNFNITSPSMTEHAHVICFVNPVCSRLLANPLDVISLSIFSQLVCLLDLLHPGWDYHRHHCLPYLSTETQATGQQVILLFCA